MIRCLAISALLIVFAPVDGAASAQGLPPAPAPVPGGLLDPNRNAKPAPAKPEPAAPKEVSRPPQPTNPQQAAPAAKPQPKATDQSRPREQARPKSDPKATPQAAPKAAATPARAPAPPRPSRPKLEPLDFTVPAEYSEVKRGRKPGTEALLIAVGPDLAPRYTRGGRCADPKAKCPDFTNLIVFRTHDAVAAIVAARYKSPPETLRTFAAAHGLSQIPPRAARGYNKRHFLATVEGRTVWVVCHRYDLPRKPRPESRYCDVTFDIAEGVAARLIFHEARLGDWRRMHAAARALLARLRG